MTPSPPALLDPSRLAHDRLRDDDDAVAFIFKHLAGHSPVPSSHPHDGIYEFTLSVDGATPDEAVTTALDLVAVAAGTVSTGVEVGPEAVYDDRAPHRPAWVTINS